MENITSEKDVFEGFLKYLTQGNLEIPPDYLDSVLETAAVNRHVSQSLPEDIYASWPASFKLLFREALHENGGQDVLDMYRGFGYEFPEMPQRFSIDASTSRIIAHGG